MANRPKGIDWSQWMSVRDAGLALNVTPAWVQRLARRGKLVYDDNGPIMLIGTASVEQYKRERSDQYPHDGSGDESARAGGPVATVERAPAQAQRRSA